MWAVAAQTEPYIADAPLSGVELGLGWDSKRNRLVPNRCISFAPVQEGGQKATLSLEEISNSAELREHLGVSASAAISALGGSADASASFVAESNVKSSSTNFAVRAAITNGSMRVAPRRRPPLRRYAFTATQPVNETFWLRSPEDPSKEADTVDLADWVSDLVDETNGPRKPKDENQFREYCGDGFVSAIHSGVELSSVISFEAKDTATRNELKAKVSASYGVGSGSAGYEEEEEAKFTNSNTRMSFLQRGGAGGPMPSSRELLVRKLELIAAEASDAPEFFDIEITPYDDLPNFDMERRADLADEILVDRYLELKSIYADLSDILHSPENYIMCYQRPIYAALQDKVARVLRLLEEAQKDVVSNDWNREELNQALQDIIDSGLGLPDDVAVAVNGPDAANVAAPSGSLIDWLDDRLSTPFLRILLPPRKSVLSSDAGTADTSAVTASTSADDGNQAESCLSVGAIEYRNRVIDQRVRPVSDRACAQSLSDRECLSNETIGLLQKYVRYPAAKTIDLADHTTATGVLCSEAPSPTIQRCVAVTRNASNTYDVTLSAETYEWATAEIEFQEDTKRWRIRLKPAADQTGESDLRLGLRRTKDHASQGEALVIAGASANDSIDGELSWAIAATESEETLYHFTANTKAKYKKEKENFDCLLAEPYSDRMLAFPNGCAWRKSDQHNPPYYSWRLYEPADLPE